MRAVGVRRSGARGFVLRAGATFLLITVLLLPLPLVPLGVVDARANGGSTYWVDVAVGNDTNPGTDAEPFRTITKACTVAGYADTIMVRPGTYASPAGVPGETFPLLLNGASLMSTGGAASTIIQGDGINRLMIAQYHQEGDVISGFKFTDGAVGPGAAMMLHLNWATGPGQVVVEDNVFEGNTTGTYNGAALHISRTGTGEHNVLVRRNRFENNSAGPSGSGGAVFMSGPIGLTVTDNEFVENRAYNGAALALLTEDVDVDITGNHISGNEAQWAGGGLYITHSGTGEHLIAENNLWANWAGQYGGGIHATGASLGIVGNDGSNNYGGEGGFAYLNGATATATNNLIFGGSADKSGAAWFITGDGGLKEVNSTVAENGGEDATRATEGSLLTITNSIYSNQYVDVAEVRNADSVEYSCFPDAGVSDPVNGNTVGAGVIFGDPLLVDPTTRDARLSPGSPCIDVADPAEAPATDYFDTARPLDGDLDGIAEPDMGFHEYDPGLIAVQHDAAGVTFDRFVTGYNAAYSGGGYVYGRWTGTKLQARFTGESIQWIGPKQPSYGKADVYVDGVKQATVDCYAPLAQATTSAVLWESATLTDAAHTLEIRLLGQKNPASSGYVVVLDRFEIHGAAPAGGGTRHDEKSGTLSGPWIYGANSAYIAKGYNYSRYTNAAFTKTFTGTRVAWIGPKTPGYGRARVYIDNVLQGTVVSQYGPTGWRERIWESKSLPPGTHTLKIVPTGTKDAASRGTIIVIDAVDVR